RSHKTQLDAARIQLRQLSPRRNIPEANRLVLAARRQRMAIWRKRHGADRSGMPVDRFQKGSRGDVPPLKGSPIIPHGQRLAVRRKGRAVDKRKLWRLKRLCRFPSPGGPDNRLAVVAAAGQQLSVPRKVNRTNAESVSNEEADGPARGDLPDLQGI